ncbi:hypothetical protein AAFF_G00302460 [Aldrovandia affinis]|uniref:creatine kinase n=1 Tax=Aldrovandia affinis TaxID=143900 RepID=A0AAD7W0C6_9TELE|nr:hypothetical protein AAFF_G00302460 [Aldrovandia affinis]
MWASKDGSLVVWINLEDHLQLAAKRTDANIREAFECICINLLKLEALYRKLRRPFVWKEQLGWVVSSPAEVGTALRASVCMKLQHLPQHKRLQGVLERLRLRMDTTEHRGLCRYRVTLLTAMEKRLELQPDRNIDDLVPAQK